MAMIFRWLQRLSDEQHSSHELATRWHMAHVVVMSVALVLNVGSIAWHYAAAMRHAAEREPQRES